MGQITLEETNSEPPQAAIHTLLAHYQNRRYGDAEKLAKIFVEKFPNHPFAWKVLGVLFKQTGRMSEALDANQKSVLLAPEDAGTHNNLGNTLQALGRFEEAEASCSKAIVRNPDYAEAHSNLRNTLQELSRMEGADSSHRKAIALKPDFVGAYYNLGTMLQALNRLEEAEACFNQAIALKPDYAKAYSNLGNTLQALGRLEEAEASYAKAIALEPDYAEAHASLGLTLKKLGGLEDAEMNKRRATIFKPDYADAQYNLGKTLFGAGQFDKAAQQFKESNHENSDTYLLKCLYQLDEPSVFYDHLDSLIDKGEINATIGSLTLRAEIRYEIKRFNTFAGDPFEYVSKVDLTERCDFDKLFVKTAKSLLTDSSVPYKSQGHLNNAHQTAGNLFDKSSDFLHEIEKVIHSEIENYRVRFQASDEGFLTNWPTNYSPYGWLVNMKRGGYIAPHLHESAWLVGAVYINVPSELKADAGKFVACLDDEKDAKGAQKHPHEIIDVATGDLVFFPASLMHYSIPFESDEARIVFPIDVFPRTEGSEQKYSGSDPPL